MVVGTVFTSNVFVKSAAVNPEEPGIKLTDEKTGENYDFEVEEILPRGSIIVFPSFLYHRVKPVKQGTRYSLVAWSNGFPYK